MTSDGLIPLPVGPICVPLSIPVWVRDSPDVHPPASLRCCLSQTHAWPVHRFVSVFLPCTIKEAVYPCQKPFLLFASSTAPGTYKSINYWGAVFLLYSDLNSSSVESFASPVEHPHQTGSFQLCLFVVLYSSLRVRVGASICVFVFLFVCLLHIDVPVFFGYTGDSLEVIFLCVCVSVWFQI